ncbi:O-antigen ligase family protein [Myroides odoratimimus]|uniref:O-antigen ligase family protein n=1 Tax=Myroides odoratimimus TaxID=76832 RepID=UPI003F44213A
MSLQAKRIVSDNALFTVIIILTFLGFYAINLLSIQFSGLISTKIVSILCRLIIGGCCLILYIRYFKKRSYIALLFTCFCIVYFFRIAVDFLSLEYFYISYIELVFYFISFVILPFYSIININVNKINFDFVFKFFLFSALLFVFLSVFYYGRFLGRIERLTESQTGEVVISPLILSYCSVLIIDVILFYFIYNKSKMNKKYKLLSFIVLVLSLFPFYLGASRGGIFALFLPIVFLLVVKSNLRNIMKSFLFIFLFIFLLVWLDFYLNSGLIDRLLGTSKSIEQQGHSALRIIIWDTSFEQFAKNPFVGDKLNTNYFNHYPHNIYLEVLQATGIIGFIPFIIVVFIGVESCYKIFRYKPELSWVTIFFLQSCMQNFFSGALYTAAWFFTGLSLVILVRVGFKRGR